MWKTVLNAVGALDATRIVRSCTEWHLTLTGVTPQLNDSVFSTCHDIPAHFTSALTVSLTNLLTESCSQSLQALNDAIPYFLREFRHLTP
jgi:hypothetical protein